MTISCRQPTTCCACVWGGGGGEGGKEEAQPGGGGRLHTPRRARAPPRPPPVPPPPPPTHTPRCCPCLVRDWRPHLPAALVLSLVDVELLVAPHHPQPQKVEEAKGQDDGGDDAVGQHHHVIWGVQAGRGVVGVEWRGGGGGGVSAGGKQPRGHCIACSAPPPIDAHTSHAPRGAQAAGTPHPASPPSLTHEHGDAHVARVATVARGALEHLVARRLSACAGAERAWRGWGCVGCGPASGRCAGAARPLACSAPCIALSACIVRAAHCPCPPHPPPTTDSRGSTCSALNSEERMAWWGYSRRNAAMTSAR